MILTLTGNADSKIIKSWSNKEPYVTGVDIECETVYNIAYGQIVYIGQTNTGYDIAVRCNANEVLKYSNLRKLYVESGEWVQPGAKLADTNGNKQKYARIEYCTVWKNGSIFPVRINNTRYFKQNPQDILDGLYIITPTQEEQMININQSNGVEYTQDQESEFTGNRW